MYSSNHRLLLAPLAAFALFTSITRAEWTNTLKPTGTPTDAMAVADDGTALCAIQIPLEPTPMEKKAADDLRLWLQSITGSIIEITPLEPAGNRITLRTDPALGTEGYDITGARRQVILAGGTGRGVINAVYALLEEDLGCRFYTNTSIRLPKVRNLALAPVPRRVIPKLMIRDPYYACAFDATWSLRNRTNSPNAAVPEEFGGYVDYAGMFVHTAAQLVPVGTYFKDHPEYFAQTADGKRSPSQLCATEPAVARIAIDHVREVLTKNPHAEIVSVSKNDNTEVCHCDRCKKLRDAEGSDMANQLVVVNQVAEAIEKDHPAVVIDTLAYLETIQVPRTMRPRKNVAIRLCNDAVGAWSHPFTPAANCKVAKLVKAWSAVHDRISIWDYTVNFSHYLAPMPNLDVIAANIRFWTDNHATGVMLQGGYQGPAEQDELKCWVASKLMWNPLLDEKALAGDFIEGHYGPAAPAIGEYYTLLDQAKAAHAEALASPGGGIRYGMDSPFLTPEFITKSTELFTRARTLAGKDKTLQRRVDRAELPLLYVKCVRGPEVVGKDYAKAVADFERLCKREKIQYLQEGGPDFAPKLASYKAKIQKPTTRPKKQ